MSNGKSTNEGMEDLIILVNSIQDLLTPLNLNFTVQLPQIAVVGAQSVGKSSVLENIVGREFIPRGKDIVTRRPLIIQLINSDEEYGLFLHKPDEVYTDFNAICKEIQDETDRELGKQKNVSTKPINLKIYSPHVVNLTLVDLPGLTKVPVGDQPSNIDEIIHKMVRDFVESDHTLILAVSSATQDIATSDALKVAREVDPRGERTIGILTHLDLMSPGTNACDVLENRVFSLKRGYVGVVNRSQDDIEKRKDIKYGLQKEEEFFLSTKCYRDMADRMGIKYLQRLLNSQLKCHIKERIPNIRQSLYQNLIKFRNELGAYQDNYDDTDASRIGFILQLVNKFIEHFKTSLLGFSENIELESINAGSLINKSLYNEVIKKMKIEMNITEDNIMRAILNNNAIRTGLLVPQLAFDCLCKESIERYKVPLSEAISYIKDLMFNAVESSASLLQMYPRLKDEVIFKVKNIIVRQEEVTKQHILDHIQAEISFLNTRHPNFNYKLVVMPSKSGSVVPVPIKRSKSKIKLSTLGKHDKEEREYVDVEETKSQISQYLTSQDNYEDEQITKLGELVYCYLQIVDINVEDMLLKYIVCFLIKKSINYVISDLVSDMASTPNPSLFLEEYSEQAIMKQELKDKVKALETALKIVSEI